VKSYNNVITLSKNRRGIWDIDPCKGCSSGLYKNPNGCYNDCYAAKNAKRYGIDFKKTVYRDFKSYNHLLSIRRKIEKIDMPFIRMGCSGDPSENWSHTINICEKLQREEQLQLFEYTPKEIVIITKHWTNLSDSQLVRISKLNICINTSISVLDDNKRLANCIKQYESIKPYCKSIIRLVTCNFNINNSIGRRLFKRQYRFINRYKFIDTVFRPSMSNELIKQGIINVSKRKFMNSTQLLSKYNKRAYIGNCQNCIDKCGIAL